MVVDDNQFNLLALTAMLNKYAEDIKCVFDVGEVMDVIQQFNPQIVITDINLESDIDGF